MNSKTQKRLDNCPNRHNHTDLNNLRYVEYHEWAAEKVEQGLKNIKCEGCGLFAIWIKECSCVLYATDKTVKDTDKCTCNHDYSGHEFIEDLNAWKCKGFDSEFGRQPSL